MKKRILTLALALVMCLSLLPATALAAEDDFMVIPSITISVPAFSDLEITFTNIVDKAFVYYEKMNLGTYVFAGKGATVRFSKNVYIGIPDLDNDEMVKGISLEADKIYSIDEWAAFDLVSETLYAKIKDGSGYNVYMEEIPYFRVFMQEAYSMFYNGSDEKTVISLYDYEKKATLETPSSWAAEQVNAAITANLVPDVLQSKYTQATTRAEFCALAVALYETATDSEITERAQFSDTTDVNVEKMAALSVVNGVGENKFDPNAKLTREQAATMLSRLANAIGKPLTEQAATFGDNGSVSSWAADAVGQMQATGIMGGVGNNTFAPKSDYTREQSIITMMRLFDIVK
jgi:S-layer homology domain.